MPAPKPFNCCLSLLTGLMLSLSVSGQDAADTIPRHAADRPRPSARNWNPLIHLDDLHLLGPAVSKDRLPVRRWSFSFNPWGLLEHPMAIGAGIGYRIGSKVEIWSETSLMRAGWDSRFQDCRGVREILQVKRFIGGAEDFFVAAEIRYKSFRFRDTADFYNPGAGGDTLFSAPYHSHHYFWGLGLQAGKRWLLRKDGRLQLELTAGLGVKFKTIHNSDIGPGYEDIFHSIDLNAREIMNTPGTTIYLPGSLRLIWTVGKRL